MAGSDPGFSSTDFKSAIRAAMNMGAPTDTSLQVTFLVPGTAAYADEDRNANPYDWSSTPTSSTPASQIQVPCAVEWAAGGTEGTPAGIFDTSKVIVTLLDDDYATIEGVTEMLIGDRHYSVVAQTPPMGLFDVTIYQIHGAARG